MTNKTQTFIEYLEEIREKENLSGMKFAQRSGISPAMYTLVRQGKRKLGWDSIMDICRAWVEKYPEIVDVLWRDALRVKKTEEEAVVGSS